MKKIVFLIMCLCSVYANSQEGIPFFVNYPKLLGAEETMFEMPDMELQEETESQKEWEQKAYDAENRYWQEREEEVDKP